MGRKNQLTLRQAFDAGYEALAFCRQRGCSGRELTRDRLPSSVLDTPLSALVERNAFRCERCGPGWVTVQVRRSNVGVSVKVAEFEQRPKENPRP